MPQRALSLHLATARWLVLSCVVRVRMRRLEVDVCGVDMVLLVLLQRRLLVKPRRGGALQVLGRGEHVYRVVR